MASCLTKPRLSYINLVLYIILSILYFLDLPIISSLSSLYFLVQFSHIPPCFHAKPPDFPRLLEPREYILAKSWELEGDTNSSNMCVAEYLLAVHTVGFQ